MSIYRTDDPLILSFCFCHRKRGMDSGNVKKLLIFVLAVCLFCEYRSSYSPFDTPKKEGGARTAAFLSYNCCTRSYDLFVDVSELKVCNRSGVAIIFRRFEWTRWFKGGQVYWGRGEMDTRLQF